MELSSSQRTRVPSEITKARSDPVLLANNKQHRNLAIFSNTSPGKSYTDTVPLLYSESLDDSGSDRSNLESTLFSSNESESESGKSINVKVLSTSEPKDSEETFTYRCAKAIQDVLSSIKNVWRDCFCLTHNNEEELGARSRAYSDASDNTIVVVHDICSNAELKEYLEKAVEGFCNIDNTPFVFIRTSDKLTKAKEYSLIIFNDWVSVLLKDKEFIQSIAESGEKM